MRPWAGPLPYFPAREVACKGSGIIRIDTRFAAALPFLRERWGGPLTPTSVCRSPGHNRAIDGHPSSLHLTVNPDHPTHGAMAADLLWKDWETAEKLRFSRLAWSMGWSVGLHDTFIHIDWRSAIGLHKTIFFYNRWSKPFSKEDIF